MEEFKKSIGRFMPYLEDLRHRLFIGGILYAVSFIVGFFLTSIFVRKIVSFVNIETVTITATSPFQYVQVAMNFGFFMATMIIVPYIIYSLYVFILPALTKTEKIKLFKSIPVSVLLFILGFFYGFFILYFALEVLAAINTSLGVANYWNIGKFLSQLLTTSALLGLVFEFPLLLSLFIMFGVVTTETLKNNRRVAYMILLCATVLLPPTDVVSLVAMVLPLLVLYEITIVLNTKKQQYFK
jgi:sec-independent protein translocase protein TatC